MTLSANTNAWLHGLLSAFIGSAASSMAAIFVAPQTFNIYTLTGWQHIAVMALVSGIASVATYLKQSPLPTPTTTSTTKVEDINAGIITTKVDVVAPTVEVSKP